MNDLRWILILMAISGCTTHKEMDSSASQRERLEALVKSDMEALAAVSDPGNGWPSVQDCDGTLWAGIACAGGAPVKIDLAEYTPGEIHRRPAPACWNTVNGDVGSKSTISNDQILGYMWCLWSRKSLTALQRFADKVEDADWVMGQPIGALGDVVLRPNQIGMLGRAIYHLSNGVDDRYYRRTAKFYDTVDEDYARHLQAMAIVLQGEISEALAQDHLKEDIDQTLVEINDMMLRCLQELVEKEPLNAGFHIALGIYTGNMDKGIELLLSKDTPIPSYVRGKNPEAFALSERLFWSRLALKRMNK